MDKRGKTQAGVAAGRTLRALREREELALAMRALDRASRAAELTREMMIEGLFQELYKEASKLKEDP